jgi:hypothetical protein
VPKPELQFFHAITDEGSARVRRYLVDHELSAAVMFRNVVYPEAQAALTAVGGTTAPALWDGQKLFVGPEAIIARLEAWRDIGRG